MIAVVDAILVLTLVEAAGLVVYNRMTGRGIAPLALVPNMAAGFSLMLGIRLTLEGAGSLALPACFVASLACHLADLASRWRRDRELRPQR